MFIVGIGGTTSATSSSDTALQIAAKQATAQGAEVELFCGPFLQRLPLYDPAATERTDDACQLVAALRRASGVIVSGSAYHGSVSGMLKNALDYTEDMAADPRTYFSGVPVGSIVVARGWQAGVTTLTTLRMIIHALRGWPTPYGCVINTAPDESGAVAGVAAASDRIGVVVGEVLHAARVFAQYERSVAS